MCELLQIPLAKTEVQNYPETPLNATEFQDYITEFLVTGDGIKHAEDSVVFEKKRGETHIFVLLCLPHMFLNLSG